MIAMALACQPKLLIADEPTTALDVTVQAQILRLLGELQGEYNMAMLLITHDLALVADHCDSVAVMYAGRVAERRSVAALFAQPAHPYTQALLSAIPLPEPGSRRQRILLVGDVPSPANPPPGCPFHTRCRHAQSLCSQEPPPLTGPDQHAVACHFWRDIEPPPPMGSSPPNIRLQRLQSAFIN
jgi:oligopeptide transport system ATP-binding protein